MSWLLALDAAGFRWVNQSWANPFLDGLMPFASGNAFFTPALVLIALLLAWRGGARGRTCLVMLVLLVGLLTNTLLVDPLKRAWSRPRPFASLPDARLLVGHGSSGSMPSGHAANWFAAAAVAWVYYRRSWLFMLPLATLVGLSRIYNGVHYPTDVLAGAGCGLLAGLGGVWCLHALWQAAGPRWFPLWWRQLSSLVKPVCQSDPLAWRAGVPPVRDPAAAAERQWLYLGYGLIIVGLLARLAYLRAGIIELSKDEAYQWLWSKHLALSYYSKPPLIACFQFLGTRLCGDTALGVRFFAPVMAAAVSWLVLRFFARECSARAGFFLLLAFNASPLLALGTVLFTVDAPSVLFWVAALVSGWKAIQRGGSTRLWAWTGLWLGLGFLSKYTGLFQWVSFGLVMLFWPQARAHLRRPGPYLALVISALCTLPVLWWNFEHGWITLDHLHARAGMNKPWQPTLRFFSEFTAAEWALLNPVFAVAMAGALAGAWRWRHRQPLLLYLLLMGAPLFLGYWLYSLRARVQPNWIAPAVVPLYCLLFVYGEGRWRAGVRGVSRWLAAGLAVGLPAVALLHQSDMIGKLVGYHLPPEADPLRRVRAWRETADTVMAARNRLAAEGKPVFVISDHYGMAGLFSFYIPEAKAGVPHHPLVYCQTSPRPENQFYFWPGYRGERTGDNAVFVTELSPYSLGPRWWWHWLRGKPVPYAANQPRPDAAPPELLEEFESVEDLGVQEVQWRQRGIYRRVHLFACRKSR
jgi:membrane-associated phospholipid phosphatase